MISPMRAQKTSIKIVDTDHGLIVESSIVVDNYHWYTYSNE